MSRAILVIALARTLHRQPTESELTDFLFALRDLGGERVYIPQRESPSVEDRGRIAALRRAGHSIRQIAKEVNTSKSHVHRLLSQNSELLVDEPAD